MKGSCMMISNMSSHSGFDASIRFSFQRLRQCLMMSRRSAAWVRLACGSYQTRRVTWWRRVKCEATPCRCMATRRTRSGVAPVNRMPSLSLARMYVHALSFCMTASFPEKKEAPCPY